MVWCLKTLCLTQSHTISPIFSSVCLTILYFSLRCVVIHIFLCKNIHLFQHHYLKRLFIPHWTAFVTLSKVNWPYLSGSISGHIVCCIIYVSNFSPTGHTILTTIAFYKNCFVLYILFISTCFIVSCWYLQEIDILTC